MTGDSGHLARTKIMETNNSEEMRLRVSQYALAELDAEPGDSVVWDVDADGRLIGTVVDHKPDWED